MDAILLHVFQAEPMGVEQVFGWIQTLLTQIGVWEFLGTIIKVGLLITASTWAIKMFRG